jgi:hypothetical protein
VHGGAATIFDLLPDGSDSVFAAGCDWLELCVVVHGGTMMTFTFALLGSTTWFCCCGPLDELDCCVAACWAPAPPGVTRTVLLGGGGVLPLEPLPLEPVPGDDSAAPTGSVDALEELELLLPHAVSPAAIATRPTARVTRDAPLFALMLDSSPLTARKSPVLRVGTIPSRRSGKRQWGQADVDATA